MSGWGVLAAAFAESGEGQRQRVGRAGSHAGQGRGRVQGHGANQLCEPPPLSQTSATHRGSLEHRWDHARTELLWSLAKESFAGFHLN